MTYSGCAPKPPRFLAVSVLAGLCALPLAAQDEDATGKATSATSAPTFYATATVRERAVEDSATSVTVLERDAIEASGAQTLSQILGYVPGVYVSSGATRGGVHNASLRGGDPNFTFVLLDGVPLNDVTDPQGGAFNLDSLPASVIERVEVVRGPTSSFYGSTGLAGIVHVFTRRPSSERLNPEVEVEGGSASLRRAVVAVGGSHTREATARRGDTFVGLSWEEERERIARESFEQWNFQGGVGLPLGRGSLLRVTTRAASWQAGDYPETSGGPLFGSGELRDSDNEELSAGLELLLSGADGSPRHRLSATWSRHDLERDSPGVVPFVPPSLEATSYRRTRVSWTSTLLARSRFELGGGVDVEGERGKNGSVLLLSPAFGGTVVGDYRIRRTQGGVHLQLDAERGEVAFEVGLRADLVEAGGEELSPRIGLSYRPGGGPTRLRASFGRAFKLPSFFALASPPALGGNPALKPETTVGFDVGIEHTFQGRRNETPLSLGLTAFSSRFEDLIDFDFATFLHVNRSRVDARGVELSLSWRPSSHLTVKAGATLQETEDRATGEALLRRPDFSGSLRLTWRPVDDLSLFLDAQSLSRLPDRQLPVPGRRFAAPYERAGLAAAWRLGSRWEIRARVENLFDEDYETLIGFPGAPRSFRLGLRVRGRAEER